MVRTSPACLGPRTLRKEKRTTLATDRSADGDAIRKAGLHDPNAPLLEFARHFRDACAHGGRWSIQDKESWRPARSSDLELAPDINGTKAHEVVSPMDYVVFLDEI